MTSKPVRFLWQIFVKLFWHVSVAMSAASRSITHDNSHAIIIDPRLQK